MAKPTKRIDKRRPAKPAHAETTSIELTKDESTFLLVALASLTMQGTPDRLLDNLAVVQGIRLKITRAAQRLGAHITGPQPSVVSQVVENVDDTKTA